MVRTETSQASASSAAVDRKSTRLNSSHLVISYAVFCLKKKTTSHCAIGTGPNTNPSLRHIDDAVYVLMHIMSSTAVSHMRDGRYLTQNSQYTRALHTLF